MPLLDQVFLCEQVKALQNELFDCGCFLTGNMSVGGFEGMLMADPAFRVKAIHSGVCQHEGRIEFPGSASITVRLFFAVV